MSTTLDLIKAIEAGNSRTSLGVFEELAQERVVAAIDQRRGEISANLFAVEESALTEEKLDEMSDDDFEALVEGFEQLDELSQDTMHSYLYQSRFGKRSKEKLTNGAANAEEHGNTDDAKLLKHQAEKRSQGMASAGKKINAFDNKKLLNKQTPEAPTKTVVASQRKVGLLGKIKAKIHKMTEDKFDAMSDDDFYALVEDYEQLDELSKGTLAGYIKKANSSGGLASFRQGKAVGNAGAFSKRPDKASAKENAEISDNRTKGIHKAVDKLAK